MANCVQFKGPGYLPPLTVTGQSSNRPTRTRVKEGVDQWEPTGMQPFRVLIAAEVADVLALLNAWSTQFNQQQANNLPGQRQTVSVTDSTVGATRTVTVRSVRN